MDHLALIVDDDQHTLILWNAMLKSSNIEVLKAIDGAQALTILENKTPTILLLDLLLPYVSGREILEYVAKTPRLNDMFVVVISAQQHTESAHLDRANAILVKPIRPTELRELLEPIISRAV